MTEEEILEKLEKSRESAAKGNYKSAESRLFQNWGENMDYKVVVTSDAEEDFDRFIQYLLLEKKNEQAARNVLDDLKIH